MWKCQTCNHKNNNSSERCHGLNCNQIRHYDNLQKIHVRKKDHVRKRIYDFCPNCKIDTFWLESMKKKGKKEWICEVCKKHAHLKGKSKPIPVEIPNEPTS